MPSGGYHIILIPKDATKARRFHLSSLTTRVFGLSLLLIIPLIIGSLFSALHYQNKIVNLKQEMAEDRQLFEQKEIMATRLTGLERSLERTEQSLQKLETVLGVEGGEMKSGLGPVDAPLILEERSGSFVPSFKSVAIDNIAEDEMGVGGVRQTMNTMDQRIEGLKSQMEVLYSLQADKIRFLHAMPSIMPVDGWITSDFGFRRSPYAASYKMHDGIDIASPTGTPIKAPADGRVVLADYKGGYGRKVIIDHGFGVSTVFAHASQFFVKEGDKVTRGDVIAAVGSTGASTGPHLHYEVHVDGIPADPLNYIKE